MTTIVTLLYPKGTIFNIDYYLSHHQPLVREWWSPMGMASFKVVELSTNAPYLVQAIMEWDNLQHFDEATKDMEVMGDIPNFSNKQPIM